ncbi:MAG: hypothetical protein K0Q49_1798 [Haloplasmataceae bacterium]|jgi:hypothetical protein|nr:hypothetical protein [Haloplasmataceae bacterium]
MYFFKNIYLSFVSNNLCSSYFDNEILYLYELLNETKYSEVILMNFNPNGSSLIYNLSGLVEGDQIHVLPAGGNPDCGVFIRVEDGFLIWVKNFQGNPVLAITSLDGISIGKI